MIIFTVLPSGTGGWVSCTDVFGHTTKEVNRSKVVAYHNLHSRMVVKFRINTAQVSLISNL